METIGTVKLEQVLWNYLAHEVEYRQPNATFIKRLALREHQYPSSTPLTFTDYCEAVEAALGRGDPLCTTIDQLAQLKWEFCAISCAELGRIYAQLPADRRLGKLSEYQGEISKVFGTWRAYICTYSPSDWLAHKSYVNQLADRSRLCHTLVLRADLRPGLTVADGRHRAFALFEYCARTPGFGVEAYVGRPT